MTQTQMQGAVSVTLVPKQIFSTSDGQPIWRLAHDCFRICYGCVKVNGWIG
ncbi:hypothetical protein M2350_002401 [Candidatus Fervidibacter sacchari]|uniref:Uncharacterized protein n=1 Tax=Candidatus Fervidibacter sacchari TaxID=1448929 RepID=A0ABT2EPU4_9BACT|nr:hypothetical protein [Candidatus Fervidibacter sacchari]